jgi:hypothetical protein
MMAQLHRAYDDLSVMYRQTDLTKPPVQLAMREVAHSASSVTSKIVGSFITEGIVASMVNPSKDQSRLENLLRS